MAANPITPFLGLVKPIVGDPAGEDQWGGLWNANADKIDAFASSQGALIEAPQDGRPYSRQSASWVVAPTLNDFNDVVSQVDDNVTDITALQTTSGVNSSAITALQAKDVDLQNQINTKATDVPAGQTDYFLRTAGLWAEWKTIINWGALPGKPTTFPPTLPIAQSGITNLVTDLAGKEPVIAPGDPASFWAGDKTWKPVPPAGITEPASGNNLRANGSWVPGLPLTGGTLSGDLNIVATDARFALNPPTAGGQSRLRFQANSLNRWDVARSEDAASNFQIRRFDDVGGLFPIDIPLSISRATGVTNFTQTPTVNGVPLAGGAVISDTPPSSPIDNSLWWQSTTGIMFVRFNDGTSTQWVATATPGLSDASATGGPWARSASSWYDISTTFATTAQLAGYLPLTGGSVSGGITSAGILQGSQLQTTGALIFNNISNYQLGYAGGANITTGTGLFQLMFAGSAYFQWQPSNAFRPLDNGGTLLGASSQRWGQIYSSVATISTSDEKLKQDIQPLTEAEKRVAVALRSLIVTYRWKQRVEAEGEAARIHTGIVAQRVAEAFAAEGLDAARYGLWCEDDDDEYVQAVTEERDGEVVTVKEGYFKKLGTKTLSIRYEELLAFIIGGL
jgi:hypothetical protein